jgi:hypothetical protein
VPVKLIGNCASAAVWVEVASAANQILEGFPTAALGWTILVRPKTDADDRMLVEDGEADDPAHYLGGRHR